MGMNMLTKGSEKAMLFLCSKFEGTSIVTLSGNMYIYIHFLDDGCRCTDKKASSVNWLLGRGKSVSCEAYLSKDVVQSVLKCTIRDISRLNTGMESIQLLMQQRRISLEAAWRAALEATMHMLPILLLESLLPQVKTLLKYMC